MKFGILAVALVIGLGVAEGMTRLLGHYHLVQAWRNYAPATRTAVAARWVAYDAELGWINAPNTRVTWNSGPATFLQDGSRRTGESGANDRRPLILILGCSYTQGFGVADAETFAWQLQERFPTYHVVNFGTGAYGTYQSLLRFRRVIKNTKPSIVVFGFGEFHGARD